jgi:hypothetical protein
LLDDENAGDLPFGEYHPGAAAFALIDRWTRVAITEAQFVRAKPTLVVQTPAS